MRTARRASPSRSSVPRCPPITEPSIRSAFYFWISLVLHSSEPQNGSKQSLPHPSEQS